ncbi:MAG: hypothetical protein JW969_17095 [Spirochaetales bacterium]|nr:hypothetical protein [Spirochaetales bacterium]
MGKVVLLTDIDTPLGYGLLNGFHQQGYSIIATTSSKNKEHILKNIRVEVIGLVEWNRYSSLDVRNIIYKAKKRFGRVDEAYIIQTLPVDQGEFIDIESSDISHTIDKWLKGNIFLAKEIIKSYKSSGAGLICLINHLQKGKDTRISPLTSVLWEGYSGFMKTMIASPIDEVTIHGFKSAFSPGDEFADYILRTLTEKNKKGPYRFYEYSAKKGLFSGFKSSS